MPTVQVAMSNEALDNVQESANRLNGSEIQSFPLAEDKGIEVDFSFEDTVIASRFRMSVSRIPGVINADFVRPENIGGFNA